MRVNVNTVFGLGGILDVATEAGIDRHSEDFGQTLGRWGVPAGPYLVLPLLGPSTVRDTPALPVDVRATPCSYVDDGALQGALFVLARGRHPANLLRASQCSTMRRSTSTRSRATRILQRRQIYEVPHDGTGAPGRWRKPAHRA